MFMSGVRFCEKSFTFCLVLFLHCVILGIATETTGEFTLVTSQCNDCDFGRSLALSTSAPMRLVITAQSDPSVFSGAGAAFVYVASQDSLADPPWSSPVLVDSLYPQDVSAERFGVSCDIEGDTIVVGADRHNTDTGRVYAHYESSLGTNDFTNNFVLLYAAGISYSTPRFGSNVAIRGLRVYASARFDGLETKHIFVFSESSEDAHDWHLAPSYIEPLSSTSISFLFPSSFAVDGLTVAAGLDVSKEVYVFTEDSLNSNTYTQQILLGDDVSDHHATSSFFGRQVDVSGHLLAVCEQQGYTTGNSNVIGRIYIYSDLNNPGTWEYQVSFSDDNFVPALPLDYNAGVPSLGMSMFIDGNVLWAGAPGDGMQKAGVMYAFQQSETGAYDWENTYTRGYSPTAFSNDRFSSAFVVIPNTTHILVSAWSRNEVYYVDQFIDPCNAVVCYHNSECVTHPDDYLSYSCNCADGYTGSQCESEIDYCVSSPCSENSAECISEPGSFTCACNAGFTGNLCENELDECISSPCLHGICIDAVNNYSCDCTGSGYEGNVCELDVNDCASSPCSMLSGTFCEDTGANMYNCTDSDDCASSPCQNKGVCSDAGHDAFECTCKANKGYTGPTCTDDIDDCESSPCLHGGVCRDTGVNAFECSYACSSSPCFNGASCYDKGDLVFGCNCTDGFTGLWCNTDIDECISSPCENGGLCSNTDATPGQFKCDCDNTGFKGSTCAKQIDDCMSLPCTNGGTCIDDIFNFFCNCSEPYSGTFCEFQNPCVSMPCQNGGTCTSEDNVQIISCHCNSNFTGVFCEMPQSDECSECEPITISLSFDSIPINVTLEEVLIAIPYTIAMDIGGSMTDMQIIEVIVPADFDVTSLNTTELPAAVLLTVSNDDTGAFTVHVLYDNGANLNEADIIAKLSDPSSATQTELDVDTTTITAVKSSPVGDDNSKKDKSNNDESIVMIAIIAGVLIFIGMFLYFFYRMNSNKSHWLANKRPFTMPE